MPDQISETPLEESSPRQQAKPTEEPRKPEEQQGSEQGTNPARQRQGQPPRTSGQPAQEPGSSARHNQTGQRQRGQAPKNSGQAPPGQQQGQPKPVDISVIIPLYNEEESLRELHQQLRSTLGRMNTRYELLFVDDGSTDRSFQVLRDLKRFDNHIKVIRFRRNYGKSAALSVGFEKALGNVIITMDADLQDDPAEIPGLTRKLNEGFDLVSGWKKVRHDPISKTIPSKLFNFVTSKMTRIKIHDFNCGLKVYKREVVKTLKVYGELHRFIPVLAHWEGFKIGEMAVQHRMRKYGKTKFGIGRFWKGFLDLLTVLFTTHYFRRPLHLFGFWGMTAFVAGCVIVLWLAGEWALGKTVLGNRPLFLGGILLIIVGIQIVSIGLLGEMISKTKNTEDEYSIKDYIR